GRLLADRAEAQRQGLVHEPGRLAADADLEQDEVGPLERAIASDGGDQTAAPAGPVQHPPSESAHDPEALGVHIEQDQVIDRESVAAAREPLDQLRRICAAPADNNDLQVPLLVLTVTGALVMIAYNLISNRQALRTTVGTLSARARTNPAPSSGVPGPACCDGRRRVAGGGPPPARARPG